MITAYRIFKTKHSAAWSDGEGAFRFGGRWNSRGTRLLYTSASLSLAVLEMLVHLDSEELMSAYSYAAIEFDEKLVVNVVDFQKLPPNWGDSPTPVTIQEIGDGWARSNTSAVLKVPTSILPGEFNYILNVEHPDFPKINLGEPWQFVFDNRLRKKRPKS